MPANDIAQAAVQVLQHVHPACPAVVNVWSLPIDFPHLFWITTASSLYEVAVTRTFVCPFFVVLATQHQFSIHISFSHSSSGRRRLCSCFYRIYHRGDHISSCFDPHRRDCSFSTFQAVAIYTPLTVCRLSSHCTTKQPNITTKRIQNGRL
jgi:hypothetical protein